jgi:hypothetical protein
MNTGLRPDFIEQDYKRLARRKKSGCIVDTSSTPAAQKSAHAKEVGVYPIEKTTQLTDWFYRREKA